MPIYSYQCRHCGFVFERIERVTEQSWKDSIYRMECSRCGSMLANKLVNSFKIGSKILDTTGRSGYLTDDFTMGKLIDEGGISYEEKSRLKKRGEMIDRQKEFTKGLKEREKKYNFSSASDND